MSFKEGRPEIFDIFRREARGGVVWMGTANDEEEVRETVRKLHSVNPSVYFTFDHSTRTRRTITPEELGGENLEE
jgi:hypothetical protein